MTILFLVLVWLALGFVGRLMIKYYWVNYFGKSIGWDNTDRKSMPFLVLGGFCTLCAVALHIRINDGENKWGLKL